MMKNEQRKMPGQWKDPKQVFPVSLAACDCEAPESMKNGVN